MRIVDINSYRDGGTIRIITDEGDYSIDNRINSKTKGKVYVGRHPNYGVLDNFQDEIVVAILEGLEEYKVKNYESWNKWNERICELLKEQKDDES